MIDYSKEVTRSDIDVLGYEERFKLIDEYSKSKDIRVLRKVLDDPTLFIYQMFRLDGNPLKLYPYQDLIIRDSHQYVFFRASNQIGKSLLLDAKCARNLLIPHGKAFNSAIVSKSLPQSIFQMRRIKSLLNTMDKVDWQESKGSSDSMSVVTVDIKDDKGKLMYSNMLICAPCTEGLLGYDLHDLNLDEFEFWDVDLAYFFEQIALPRTYATHGKITIFSNPNGQDSYGAKLESQRDKNGNRVWHTYVFNYLDRPGASVDEFERLKLMLPRARFESTVAAIRSLSDRNYFTNEEIERSYDPNVALRPDVQTFMFLDVGAKHDQSVLSIGYVDFPDGENSLPHIYIPIIKCYPVGYPLSRVVGAFSEGQDSDGWHYEKSVKDYYLEFLMDNITPTLGVDVTGNSGIIPLMETVGLYPEDVVFSGPQKSSYYQRFKYYMEKGLLHRCDSKEFDYQCAHLILTKTARGYLQRKKEVKYDQIHHESEEDLDDVPDSVAGLIALADPRDIEFASPSVKVFWVGENNDGKTERTDETKMVDI